jgi:hypothetical protein
MNLGELQARASALRQRPLTADTRTALETLRNDAVVAGPVVAAALDRHLQTLFVDVYGGRAPPRLSLTNAGPPRGAHALSHGGARGAALQFFGLQGAATMTQPSVPTTQPTPSSLASQVVARVPAMSTTTLPSVPIDVQFPALSSSERKSARAALDAELSSVRTRGGSDLLAKFQQFPGLSSAQKARVLDVLAEVKAGYARVGAALGDKPGGVAYQDVNWKHTRLELDRVLDVATAMKLSPAEAETALLASIVSDATKTPANFLVHNVHGAQAALHLLSRLSPPPSTELLEDVVQATLEHQIGPPGFMANVALRNALKAAGVDGAVIASITAKVAAPLDAKHQTADRTQLAFSDKERAALAKVGVTAWTVPHEGSRHHRASRAVVDADSLVNYACPDGWAKLAALHGPDQPVFLQEPRLVDGLMSERPEHASALKSYRDAFAVVSDDSRALYSGGLARTKQALERVQKDLERWVAGQPARNVPRTKDGRVPYLDGDLDYGNAVQVAFARRLRDEAVRLLRQQESL